MSYETTIEWTDTTWNPVRGCTKISPGCKNCYAEAFAERFRGVAGHPFEKGFDLRLIPGKLHDPLRWKKPRKIFVNSMSDLFHEQVPQHYIQRVFRVMERADWHTFQILTKRSDRAMQMASTLAWPRNVWMGVSVEAADYTFRIYDLIKIPAAVRFLSIEPLLGPIPNIPLNGIHWIIVGGESGVRARPMQLDWAAEIRDQCQQEGVAFFLKQLGGRRNKRGGADALLEGRRWFEMPEVRDAQRTACNLGVHNVPVPRDTLWELDPHSIGKHLVLRSYLDGWLPILGSWNRRILIIDGFAGPGEYKGGEPGSPQIILRAFADHSSKSKISAQVQFWFIEERPDRFAHLQTVLEKLKPSLAGNYELYPICGRFDSTLTTLLEEIDQQKRALAPTFLMIDPFGVSGTPMAVISRVMQNPRAELYISFMYEAINMRKELPEFQTHLDEMFGTADWRKGIGIVDADERKSFFYDLYSNQLRSAGANYVLRFELYEGQRLVYAIFFATKSLKGSDLMKQSIWKIAPLGEYAFYGSRLPQLKLGLNPSLELLKAQLRDRFKSAGWISIESIEDFIRSDQTDFHSRHLKKLTLVPMEIAGQIEVDEKTRKRRNSYPSGTRLRFL